MSHGGPLGTTWNLIKDKGDLITFSSKPTDLNVGADGEVLTADSSTATGLKWATAGTSSPLTTKGDVYTYSTVNARLGVGADGQVLTADSAEATGIKWAPAAGGGDMPPKEYWFSAESLQPLETNFAPLEKLTGTNVKVFVRSFNDTTEEYVNGKLQVPGELDTTGTVTFRAYVSAKTAAASKNIGLTFGHLAINGGEDWDPSSPYTEEDSGAVAIDATQDNVTEVTWTETVANLGWAANDLVIFRLSRDTGVTGDLTDDLYLFSLAVEIPRSA